MGIIISIVGGLLVLAGIIDWRRKRNKNDGERAINSHAKPGEEANYVMGDNHHMTNDF